MPFIMPQRLSGHHKPEVELPTLLSAPQRNQYAGLLALAAQSCHAKYALVDLFHSDLQVHGGPSADPAPCYKPGGIYSRMTSGPRTVVIDDTRIALSAELDQPEIDQQVMGFCAVTPLRMMDGTLAGALCVLDHKPRRHKSAEPDNQTLDVLARQIEATLNLTHAVAERDGMITEQRILSAKLDWAATHDPLTLLLNRAAFQSHLERLLSGHRPSGRSGALLLVDIDHFKQVNDSLGHFGGDHVLRHYAQRLEALVGPAGMVARVGGDEFAVACADVGGRRGAEQLAETISQGMRMPMLHDGRTVDGRSSIGISLFPDNGVDVEALTRGADLALQAAKRAGRDRFVIFDATLAHQAAQHEQILAAAHAAIEDGRVRVYYQPIVTLDDGKVQGLEALMRWIAPSGELVLPGTWGAAFDDPQLAPAISRYVLDQVLRDVADWLATGVKFGHVAINAGTLDFSCGTFTEDLLGSLAMRRLPPDAIQIEITEMVLLGRSNGQVARALAALNDCGIRIALDDFGTGYASLIHLKSYPIDTVKIDGSFVAGLNSNAEDRAIVKSVIALARDLGIKSVAEGIETDAQASFLRNQGCDYGQGFLFSEALTVEQVNQLIAQSSSTDGP